MSKPSELVIFRFLIWNHRGGGSVYRIDAVGDSITLREQTARDEPEHSKFRSGQIDLGKPYRTTDLTIGTYEAFIAKVRTLKLPVFPPDNFGFDGTTYYVWISNGRNEVMYSWWLDCPTDWAVLNELISEVQHLAAV